MRRFNMVNMKNTIQFQGKSMNGKEQYREEHLRHKLLMRKLYKKMKKETKLSRIVDKENIEEGKWTRKL